MIEVLRAIGEDVATQGTSTRRLDADRDAIVAALSREEMVDLLEDAAVALRDTVAIEPLKTRALAEYELLGAAFVLRCSSDDLPSPARVVFDAVVKPESWRLVVLNEERQTALARILPAHRKRFWWWSDGIGVPATALDAMSATAQLIARFPAARARLDALVRAEEAWKTQRVRTLRRWLVPEELPLAAAPGEVTVLERPEVEVSFAAPSTLIVDLLGDRVGPPLLGATAGEPVARAEQRFTFALSEEMLESERLVLVVGDVEIVLPPAEA